MDRHSYNRHARRAAEKKGVCAKCAMCASDTCMVHVMKVRAIYEGDATAPSDLAICKGCACADGRCHECGETGQHWLGCARVGLPGAPIAKTVLQ